MKNTYDVISAFLDDEAFDSDELAHALSDPDGRALLIDLLALRHVMQPVKGALVIAGQRKPSRLKVMLAVAAVLMAMIGGYLLGQGQVELTDDAPPATRVIEPRAAWQPLPSGE